MRTSNDVEVFGDVLEYIDEYSDRAWLYLPSNANWGLSAASLVLVPRGLAAESDDDDTPILARTNDMFGALSVADVQDVVVNARSQRPNATQMDLLDAFVHYYDNDAYIDFSALDK